ncbi:MAG: TetR/AcrR family transcriptional regulator [Acidimicrobiia bacterium]|nr:TetR/AcrR family transcriptional regulator [Acidimicrobiia bacterium]
MTGEMFLSKQYGKLFPMTTAPSTDNATPGNLPDRIRASALEDIRLYGILGLRVTRVAKRANCSVTQIYRHFDDRDGLLADVLARIFRDISTRNIESSITALSAMKSITIPNLVSILPMPSNITDREEALLRSQILAMATVNRVLRDALSDIAKSIWPRWVEACELVESRLAPGESFDRRVVFVVLLNSNQFYNSLLDEHGINDDEYRAFMIDAFRMKPSAS